jgi:Flp pilus assembly protein TadG
VTGRGRLREERGSVAIAGILVAMVMVMLIGTAVDIGRAFIVRRDLTALTDDAALSGSQQLDLDAWRQGTLALNAQAAQQTADAQLAADPGISGSATAETSEITVQAKERFPTIVLRLVGMSELTVFATATAVPTEP